MFFQLDPEQAKSGFEPLPIGEYECIVTEAEVTTSSSGNPMIKVTLTVRDDVEQDGHKRKIFDNLVATEKAMFKFHQVGKAIGVEQAPSIESFAQSILYKPVRIKNKHEEYNGKVNDRVAVYLEPNVEYKGAGQSAAPDPFATTGIPVDISDDDFVPF